MGARVSAESMAGKGEGSQTVERLPRVRGRSRAMRGTKDSNRELMGPVGQVTWFFLASQESRKPRVKAVYLPLQHILKVDCGPGAVLGTAGKRRVRDTFPALTKLAADRRHQNGRLRCSIMGLGPAYHIRLWRSLGSQSPAIITTTKKKKKTKKSLNTGHEQVCFLKTESHTEQAGHCLSPSLPHP